MFAELCEEHRQLQDLVARFVDKELMPLEPRIIEREIRGEHPTLSPEEAAPLLAKCRELGLWGLDVPEEFGGVNLPAVALMAVNEELWRTIVPFTFPPDSPNLHMLMAVATPEQKEKVSRALRSWRCKKLHRSLGTRCRCRSLRHDDESRTRRQ